MKRSGILLTIVVALSFSSFVYAEETGTGTLAIGLHGIGSQWSYGRPMLRWRPSDKWAFDFTPVVSLRNNDSTSSGGTTGDSDGDNYGLNIGIVSLFRNIGGVSLGWRMEFGYTYSNYSTSYDSAGFNETSHERSQYFDFGVGPDLEYFVPAVRGLSIGASAQVHYRYYSSHYASDTTAFSSSYSNRGTGLDLLGEFLTVRYYF